jgi:hypothetical protein
MKELLSSRKNRGNQYSEKMHPVAITMEETWLSTKGLTKILQHLCSAQTAEQNMQLRGACSWLLVINISSYT